MASGWRKWLPKSIAIATAITFSGPARAAAPPPPPLEMSYGKDKKLSYAADEHGNRVPDFSYCGYMADDSEIPDVPIRIAIEPQEGDCTTLIQAAFDSLAAEKPDANGFRGTVLLKPGTFKVSGSLTLRASGMILRGSGTNDKGTTIVATGLDRRTLIRIGASYDRQIVGKPAEISDAYVPVNAMKFHLATASDFKVGDSIEIRRPSTTDWIKSIHMDDLGGDRHGPSWKAGTRDLVWNRTITAVNGDELSIDAPITVALDKPFGGGTVVEVRSPGEINRVGIENIRFDSTFDVKNPKDENHSWFVITMDNVSNAWVRRIESHHFAGSTVAVWDTARRITVEDCKSLEPVSEIGGWRRQAFYVTGQQVLMQRLYSEDARHDFAVGYLAAGPNAFVQCESRRSLEESGAIDSLAAGTLFDIVHIDGNQLSLRNRAYEDQGCGWAAANCVMWNSTAAVIQNWKMPGAQNWALGTWGEFSGDGYFARSNEGADPDSFYYAQLKDRIGADKIGDRGAIYLSGNDASSNPDDEGAATDVAAARKPGPQMTAFIDQWAAKHPLNVTPPTSGLLVLPPLKVVAKVEPKQKLEITNGWLTINGAIATGGRVGVPWWNQTLRLADMSKAPIALTRFVPGRIGHGYTDNIDEVASEMVATGTIAIEQHPPLWYDRRRDDHERIRRMNGDTVAPYYEHPYARSGQESSFDGLSKYDLTKPNPFYYSRLNQFADRAAELGLVLVNCDYLQHSILEAGAHYADFPWRTANNINDPGFPEPVLFAGDKRIFIGNQFYDVANNPTLKELHRHFIQQGLDQLAGKTNVIHLMSEEYTGPLEFTQFWLDTVAQWEEEHKTKVLVGLYATKDVQDAILADPMRSKIIDVIYQRYNAQDDTAWWYLPDGSLFAPLGGLNLSPRQHYRQKRAKNAGFAQIIQAVREYRTKFPDKPFVYAGDAGALNWACLIGGGSLAAVPKMPDELKRAITTMKPFDLPDKSSGSYALASDSKLDMLIYSESSARPKLDDAGYLRKWINLKDGSLSDAATSGGGELVWLHKN